MIGARQLHRAAFASILALAIAEVPGIAQSTVPPASGPNPPPPPRLDYANPQPGIISSEVGRAPTQRFPDQSIIIDDVRITAIADGRSAIPPRSWTPLMDEQSGFQLSHTPGASLDADWVRAQFLANGLIGRAVTVDRVLAIVQLINRSYLTAGFINSGLVVPEQQPGGRSLDLTLIFGQLTADGAASPITVEWADGKSRGLSGDYVRNRMDSGSAVPLNAIAVERDFRLLAADPAIRTVTADLRPGSGAGQASLMLLVKPQDPFDFYTSFANNRSPAVGGERLAFGGFLRNLPTPGSLLTAEVGTTDGVRDGSVGFLTSIGGPATSLWLRGSFNNAAVIDGTLEQLDISSRDRAGEIGVTRRLSAAPLRPGNVPGTWLAANTLSIGASVIHRRSKSFLFGQPFSFSPGFVDGRSRYTAGRITAEYIHRSVRQVFAGSLTTTVGLNGTRSDVPGVETPDRHFLAMMAQLNAARRLNDRGLEVRGRLTGQYATSVLYVGERLAAGGDSTVRGYRENLLLTDNGLIGSVELVQPLRIGGRPTPGLVDWGSFALSGFFDAAYVGNTDVGHPTKRHLASIGTTLAWTPIESISARISFARGLVDVPRTGRRDLQDRGLHFMVTVRPLNMFRL